MCDKISQRVLTITAEVNKIGSPDSVMASTPAGVSSSDGTLHRGSYGVAILGEPATQVFSNGIRIACIWIIWISSAPKMAEDDRFPGFRSDFGGMRPHNFFAPFTTVVTAMDIISVL